jgi:primosomal protein N' (replication factor Y)
MDIKGFGTEKVEEELQVMYPEANIRRMDLDSTRRKYAFQELIDDMESGDIDILVGTQMVTKGLDFEGVKLVGILRKSCYSDFRFGTSNIRLGNETRL